MTDVHSVTIELDAFSGRPNPVWTLTGPQGAAVETKLFGPAPAGRTAPLPDLGFRGFIVRAGGTTFRVYRRTVTVTDVDEGRAFADANGLEELLRREAVERGYGGLLPTEGL